jgi:hypothetical protein
MRQQGKVAPSMSNKFILAAQNDVLTEDLVPEVLISRSFKTAKIRRDKLRADFTPRDS